MTHIVVTLYRIINGICRKITYRCRKYYYCAYLKSKNVKFEEIRFNGASVFDISDGCEIKFGDDFIINSGITAVDYGVSRITVRKGAQLEFGKNSGISSTIISCHNSIIIGDNVNIGFGSALFDTDFHSLDPAIKVDRKADVNNAKSAPIYIGDNVFIGARSMILKGVSIGANSIIAAGSVVSKSVPDSELWGGVPARFIRRLNIKSID